MASPVDEVIEISHDLIPCTICGRTFLPSPLRKHIKICERSAIRKRKVFNSLKQRVNGTDLAPFNQPSFLRKNEPVLVQQQQQQQQPHNVTSLISDLETEQNSSNWKEKHEEFVKAIRAAKGEKEMGPRRSISAVGSMGTTEKCPSCDRHFGPKSFDRHVEWCKEHKIRGAMKSQVNSQAKERLEARTKYQVPPLGKSKRSVTREKYSSTSPMSRTESITSVQSSNFDRSPSLRKSKQRIEPVIKKINEQSKSPHPFKSSTTQKINDTDVNESVTGMIVSQIRVTTSKLTTWKETLNENKTIPKLEPESNDNESDSFFSSSEADTALVTENKNEHESEKHDSQVVQGMAELNFMKSKSENSIQIKYTSTPFQEELHSIMRDNTTNLFPSCDVSPILKLSTIPKCDKTPSLITETITPTKKQCNLNDLKELLSNNQKSKSNELEIEIIATELYDEDDLKLNPTGLNMYSTKSSEIVVEGSNCLETLNEILYRNEIKTVNIILVNDEMSNTNYTDIGKEVEEIPCERKSTRKCRRKVKSLKRKKTSMSFVRKRKRNANVFIPSEHVNVKDLRSLKLPFVSVPIPIQIQNSNRNRNPSPIPLKRVNGCFWNRGDDDDDHEDLKIRKSELHERKRKLSKRIGDVKLPPIINNCISINNNVVDDSDGDDDDDSGDGDSENSVTPRSDQNQIPFQSPLTHKSKPQCIKEECDPFVIAEKQLLELLRYDDFKPKNSSSSTKTSPSPKKSNVEMNSSKTKTNKKRASIIDPPDDFQDQINSLQGNFELIENFINDNYVKRNNKSNTNTNKTDCLNLNSILQTDDIDPNLINENDDLAIPENLVVVDQISPESFNNDVDHYSVQYDKKISVLEPSMKRSVSVQDDNRTDIDIEIDFEEFISSFDDNNDEDDDDDASFPTLKSFLQNSKPEKNAKQKSTVSLNSSFGSKNTQMKSSDKKKQVAPLKRSVSLSNPVVKARSMKNKQDIQDYLHVKETATPKITTTATTTKKKNEKVRELSPKAKEDLFPIDHEMYEEYKKYEEQYKKEKAEMVAEQKKAAVIQNEYEFELENQLHSNKKHPIKFSGDSAYGSLNRKAIEIQPKVANNRQLLTTVHNRLERSPSSSSSETGLVIIAAGAGTGAGTDSKSNQRMSKFCHECGTKYPLDSAKFCVECGIKRLIL